MALSSLRGWKIATLSFIHQWDNGSMVWKQFGENNKKIVKEGAHIERLYRDI